MAKKSEQETLTATKLAAAAEVSINTLRDWRLKGMFENSIQDEKGAWATFPLDAVFRGVILGRLNGLPIADESKRRIARWAEAGRVARYPRIGGHHIVRTPDGGSVATYDPKMKLALGEQCARARFVCVNLQPSKEPPDDAVVQLVDDLNDIAWTSYTVLDVPALFKRAQAAFAREAE